MLLEAAECSMTQLEQFGELHFLLDSHIHFFLFFISNRLRKQELMDEKLMMIILPELIKRCVFWREKIIITFMSKINTGISSQLASVDDHEWYHSEIDKAPIVKKIECLQVQ